jgi:hypothetical protein
VSLWIYWSLDGVGMAGEVAADVPTAVRALDISVERGRRVFDSDTPWEALRASAELMRVRMLDEGRKALERGEEWSAQIEGVQVRLIPRG